MNKNILNDNLTKMKEQLYNQLKELENSTKIDQLYSSLDDLLIDLNKKELGEIENKKKTIMIEQKFNHQLIKKSSYKQYEACHAITFNPKRLLLSEGRCLQIKLPDYIQLIKGHDPQNEINNFLFRFPY